MLEQIKKEASKALDRLERFGKETEFSATISSDGICFSESNLGIIEQALLRIHNRAIESAAEVLDKEAEEVVTVEDGEHPSVTAKRVRSLKLPQSPEVRHE